MSVQTFPCVFTGSSGFLSRSRCAARFFTYLPNTRRLSDTRWSRNVSSLLLMSSSVITTCVGVTLFTCRGFVGLFGSPSLLFSSDLERLYPLFSQTSLCSRHLQGCPRTRLVGGSTSSHSSQMFFTTYIFSLVFLYSGLRNRESNPCVSPSPLTFPSATFTLPLTPCRALLHLGRGSFHVCKFSWHGFLDLPGLHLTFGTGEVVMAVWAASSANCVSVPGRFLRIPFPPHFGGVSRLLVCLRLDAGHCTLYLGCQIL